jgi:hypothetical protein
MGKRNAGRAAIEIRRAVAHIGDFIATESRQVGTATLEIGQALEGGNCPVRYSRLLAQWLRHLDP